jgi:hypothetical protein
MKDFTAAHWELTWQFGFHQNCSNTSQFPEKSFWGQQKKERHVPHRDGG